MQRDPQFLLDMLQSAELVMIYTAQCSKAEFVANVQLQDSVIRRLLVIAEAAGRVSQTTRQNLPNIAWQEIKGMRNRSAIPNSECSKEYRIQNAFAL